MEEDALRVFDLLVGWFDVHAPRVHADRLVQIVETLEPPRTRAFWSAIASRKRKDRRFARLVDLHDGPRVYADLRPVGVRGEEAAEHQRVDADRV